ncbi:uncharacterized protein LOC108031273 isoform X1 [Drosophila biarmipes]|uniref:uncharacterized protein LOC108031273 isoform X1 n=1 Tax=Drosophila biarmipes TaxID=125945 RepID=UPI0007E69BE0|nr:uncharacterized protein LOC108031273 isoform X1 [Drosophila biarmipes]
MCRRAVREWLVLLTMEKYIGKFLERGYDSIANCKLIVASDLVMLGVDDATHRKLLLDGVQFLINAPERFICTEPCELHHHPELNMDHNAVSSKCLKNYNFLESPASEDDNPLFGPMDSPKAARRALDHEFDDLDLGEDFHLPLDSITFEKLSDEDDPLPVIMSD